MENSKAGIMNNDYVVLTIAEYFKEIKKETKNKIVAKSLVKYLKSQKSKKLAA